MDFLLISKPSGSREGRIFPVYYMVGPYFRIDLPFGKLGKKDFFPVPVALNINPKAAVPLYVEYAADQAGMFF